MKFYHFLKKNPEMNERITEARKNGVQTLIDKLLQVFQYQEIENPNQILWIREKTKFITFLLTNLQIYIQIIRYKMLRPINQLKFHGKIIKVI
jgi:hypothetical protein